MEEDWVVGDPPKNKDVCWLAVTDCVIERGEDDIKVVLAVHDGQSWCESSCWRGISCLDPIGGDIVAYKDYQVPEPPMRSGSFTI